MLNEFLSNLAANFLATLAAAAVIAVIKNRGNN